MAAAVPLGLAAVGAIQGEEERSQNRALNKAAAEQTKFSDITGRAGTLRPVGGGAFGGALQGGLAGLSAIGPGGAFGGLSGGGAAPAAAAPSAGAGAAAGGASTQRASRFGPLAQSGF